MKSTLFFSNFPIGSKRVEKIEKKVYTYVDFHNQTKSTFDKLYRVDTRDYPEIALREALLNLLALLQLTEY